MKLQLHGNDYRVRLSEAELAQLLTEGTLVEAWPCPDTTRAQCRLFLHDAADGGTCNGNLMDLHLGLPRAAFAAFAAERPRRDGFALACGQLRVLVEVDVRDSHRVRRAAQPEPN